MGTFGFLGKAKPAPAMAPAARAPDSRSIAPRIELAHVTPAGAAPAQVWSPDVVQRLSHLRAQLHHHLTASSRDYTLLTSINSSKIEYCDTVTRELMRRLASNPYFEILQNLDAAHAQLGKSVLGGGR